MGDEKFGAFVRQRREEKKIGLREMAKKIGVSPTYLSKVERDEFTPPTEDKVCAIAQIIECDPDELLAMAGRVHPISRKSSSAVRSSWRRSYAPPRACLRMTSRGSRDRQRRQKPGNLVTQAHRCR